MRLGALNCTEYRRTWTGRAVCGGAAAAPVRAAAVPTARAMIARGRMTALAARRLQRCEELWEVLGVVLVRMVAPCCGGCGLSGLFVGAVASRSAGDGVALRPPGCEL